MLILTVYMLFTVVLLEVVLKYHQINKLNQIHFM